VRFAVDSAASPAGRGALENFPFSGFQLIGLFFETFNARRCKKSVPQLR